jgi:hypothetical protein
MDDDRSSEVWEPSPRHVASDRHRGDKPKRYPECVTHRPLQLSTARNRQDAL